MRPTRRQDRALQSSAPTMTVQRWLTQHAHIAIRDTPSDIKEWTETWRLDVGLARAVRAAGRFGGWGWEEAAERVPG
eukprot:1579343-Rhodomonas_salina.1